MLVNTAMITHLAAIYLSMLVHRKATNAYIWLCFVLFLYHTFSIRFYCVLPGVCIKYEYNLEFRTHIVVYASLELTFGHRIIIVINFGFFGWSEMEHPNRGS